MTLAVVSATGPDLLRLVAIPVFTWAAIRDIKTRRISSDVWIPLALLGALLLGWEGWLAWTAGGVAWTHEFVIPAAVSLGFVVPIAYLFWWIGGFGGADAKALLVLALLFPTFPTYVVGSWTFPLTATPVGALSFTILTNAVLVAVTIPLALAVRNAVAGRIAPVMFIGWPISWDQLPTRHGRLLGTPSGGARGGLDLDALRMYLRWRGLSLAAVRDNPDYYRNPETLPDEPNPPTDGAVAADVAVEDGGTVDAETLERAGDADATSDDPWGAEAFLNDIEGSAYGTTPTELREGLEAAVEKETVWISPGTPFLVPVFVGLLIALVYGDVLIGALL
ncbi:A24 family peptidase C-terminal domain-containing protein [Natronolimnobius baerhuensis]|uniref:Peptidase A24 n=1 Tax=Natronolimnobius baerhuensis TaxID=253108 RepID=A0A202E5V3_9EURY|nr:A24 family peptidase C-terminal domain-containing protein [Natronolimnobius baerhuensis]OVE83641.1 peptidase A24 [Natronolimnobius baerhuensis]